MKSQIRSLVLRFKDVPELHEKIAQEFHAAHHHSHKAGEKVPDQLLFTGDEKWPNNIFTVESPLGPQASLSEHWTWLGNLLESHDTSLRDLVSKGAKLDVHFAFSMPPTVKSFEISDSCVELLARHRLSVFVRIISDPVFEEEGQK